MIVTTQDKIENKSISQVLGVVSGQSIRARHLGKDISCWFKKYCWW